MSKRLVRVGVIAVVLLLSTGMIGASSFTTATLERDTSIDVVADDKGVIALIDGDSGAVVQQQSNGELTIDFTVGSASGVNVNSTYELGNPNWNDASSDEEAFNITNQDGVSHTITLNYTVDSGDGVGDGATSVEFQVYDSSGTNVATEDEESGDASFTASSGETFATVVVVNTTMDGVDKNSDLSGTLNVTAT